MTFQALPASFYEPSAREVAPKLLGHWLVRQTGEGLCGGPIVETEAYVEGDPSCHAFGGQTARNDVMWKGPGLCYVYLIYGFYYCFNAVCRPAGTAEAVLVRALEPLWGAELMRSRRKTADDLALTSGPGKLCAALDIRRELNGVDLADPASPLFIAENPNRAKFCEEAGPLVTTTRIGIVKAADWPLRFYLDRSRYISKKQKRAGTAKAPRRAAAK